MIPRIIHQTARTKELTWEERRLATRIRRLLPGWDCRLWDDADNRALIATRFPQHLAAYDKIESGVMKADVARLAYMHAYGGVYLDTDYKLIRPIAPDLLEHRLILGLEAGESVSSGASRSFTEDFKLGNAFLAAERGHPLFSAMIDDIFSHRPLRGLSNFELMTISGPHGLTRFYRDHHVAYDRVWLAPPPVFYPDLRIAGLSFARTAATYGAHLCWGSWRTKRRLLNLKNRARRMVTALI